MRIQSAEMLEVDEIVGVNRYIRIYINMSIKDEQTIYEYEELLFSINDDNEYVSNRVAKVKTNLYKELRKAEYPPMEEYIDAVVKGDTVAINEYISKCLEIKVKYPKESKC
mgnify:CR=1 FL=1